MFVMGLVINFKTLIKSWNVNSSFFGLKAGPLSLLFLFHSLEWIGLIFALGTPKALPTLQYITLATALDNFFIMILSKQLLGRKLNFGHVIATIIGIMGILIMEFIEKQDNKTFKLNMYLSKEQKYAYLSCIISRFGHACGSIIYKKALLKEAAFERYKAIKLSPFRKIQLSEINEKGGLIKPTVSEISAVYQKAQFYQNERMFLENEHGSEIFDKFQNKKSFNLKEFKSRKMNREEIQDKKSQEKSILKYVKELEKLEIAKIKRQRGLSDIQISRLLQRNKQRYREIKEQINQENSQKESPNKKSKQKKYFQRDSSLQYEVNTSTNEENHQENEKEKEKEEIEKIGEEIDDLVNKKKEWAYNMSEEILEFLKDYKYLEFHEHLFDGNDDIWLSKLDEIFDSSALDFAFFGKEVPQHFAIMSLIGGLVSVPLYVIINLIESEGQLKSFMGILESFNDKNFNFYNQMFAMNYRNIIVVIILCILYSIKPLTTTNMILSSKNPPYTFLTVDFISRTVFLFITMIFIELKFKISSLEAFGLMLSFVSQLIYYQSSDKFKEELELNSACEALKVQFEYKNLSEIENVEKKLQQIKNNFNKTDAYRYLYDVALANDKRQLNYFNSSTLHFARLYDPNYYLNTHAWGYGYPRPSYELINQNHIVRDNYEFKKRSEDEVIKVKGELVYDMNSLQDAINEWSRVQNEKQIAKEDLQSHLINEQGELDSSVATENNPLINTEQKLKEQMELQSESSSEMSQINYQESESSEDDQNNEFLKPEDYDYSEKQLKQMNPQSPRNQKIQDQKQEKEDLQVKEIDQSILKGLSRNERSISDEIVNINSSRIEYSQESTSKLKDKDVSTGQIEEINNSSEIKKLKFKKRNTIQKKKTITTKTDNQNFNKVNKSQNSCTGFNVTNLSLNRQNDNPEIIKFPAFHNNEKNLELNDSQHELLKEQPKKESELSKFFRRTSIFVEDFEGEDEQKVNGTPQK